MADDDWSQFKEVDGPAPQTPVRGAYPVQPAAGDEWSKYQTVREAPVPTHYGAILPWTTYSDKTSRFEPLTSGLLGGYLNSWKDAYNFSKATQQGATLDTKDPNVMGNVLNMATLMLPKPLPARSLRTGERLAPDLAKAPATPSEDLLKTGGRQLETVRTMPVQYDPQYLKSFGNQAATELLGSDVPRSRSPQLYDLLDRIRQTELATGEPIVAKTPQQVMAWRKTLQDLYATPGETPHAIRKVMDRLNAFIDKTPAEAVLSGPAAEASALYRTGNANYSAGMRGKELAAIRYGADLARNPGTAAESGTRRALVNDTSLLGYTPAEISSLEAVPKGGVVRNIARGVGNLLEGPVGGLGSGAVTAFGGGSPELAATVGFGVPQIGKAIKNWAGQSSVNALQAAEEATRRRSPLFLEQAKNYDLTPDLAGRNAMARAIVASQTRPAPTAQPTLPPPDIRGLYDTTTGQRYDPDRDF